MSFTGNITAWIPLIEGGDHTRATDAEIARALGWRVSHDEWWNWHPGPRFDPPGDAWCIRRDGRLDLPCNEALPHFTPQMLRAVGDQSTTSGERA
jgi:hypothetical protein